MRLVAQQERLDLAGGRLRQALHDVAGTDGRIAYRGGPGPYGFKADELETAISAHLA